MGHLAACDIKGLTGEQVWFRSTLRPVNTGILEGALGTGHMRVRTADGTKVVHVNDAYAGKKELLEANRRKCAMGFGVYYAY